MQIQFTFLGLKCLAIGSMEDGNFIAESISAIGDIDTNQVPSKLFDELTEKMDKAAKQYVDNTQYFGEDA